MSIIHTPLKLLGCKVKEKQDGIIELRRLALLK